jgi:hypothetical protein
MANLGAASLWWEGEKRYGQKKKTSGKVNLLKYE